ncbi:MAG: hypothetical protein CM15mP12_2690 [Gammaproteobacteria bacterium]|nr:MAG: hypothetical protein CM15mP12_2690 [Gammaproteobacteria bacterium]
MKLLTSSEYLSARKWERETYLIQKHSKKPGLFVGAEICHRQYSKFKIDFFMIFDKRFKGGKQLRNAGQKVKF